LFLAMVQLDKKSGQLTNRPQLITRGFVFVKENHELIEQAEAEVDKALRRNGRDPQNAIRKALAQFLFSETGRRPMILPVLS
jgi:ribonuclease J